MKKEEVLIIGKKLECWVGIFLLIPPILGVIAFVLCIFGNGGDFARLDNLSFNWSGGYGYKDGGGGAMSATPIYLGLMALAGAYLLKDGLGYLFLSNKEEKEDETNKKQKSDFTEWENVHY